ncbi:MAG: exodeoxyribonuclease III [Clostridia bacterium]|nr:exodeoxyribonuclease III [Clostridia bacterium]
MKMISWNVNGLRACVKKGFAESMLALDADVICLQETKLQKGQENIELEGYTAVFNSADKKGYSGTAIYSRVPVIGYTYGIGVDEHDHEGRVITAEFEDFYLVCCYVPNSQRELARLSYRMTWEDAMREYLTGLDKVKPVVFCGDLNVAHQEIDLKNPKTNRRNAGFTDEERGKYTELLASGFADTFRRLHPDAIEYSWWSYMGHAREKNVGWRIDYFTVSERFMERVTGAAIHQDIMGSDHCPVELTID